MIPVAAEVKDGQVLKAGIYRTARRLMEGYAFVETKRIYGE